MVRPSGRTLRRIERTLDRDARISSLRRSGLTVSSSRGGWRKLSSGSVRGGWVGSGRPLVGWSGASAIFGAALATVKVQSGLGIRSCSMRGQLRWSIWTLLLRQLPGRASARTGGTVVSASVNGPSGSAEIPRAASFGQPRYGTSFAAGDLCYGVGQIRS